MPSKTPERSTTDSREVPGPKFDALRSSLSTLMGRKVPDGFPVPTSGISRRHADDPVRVAAALSRRLRVSRAVSRGWLALTRFEQAVGVLESLLPGLGWDFSTSALRRTIALDLAQLAVLLEKLPILERIVEELGRIESNARTSLVAI